MKSREEQLNLVGCLSALLGAAVAVFITGSAEEWSNVVFAVGAGLCLLLVVPQTRVSWAVFLLAVLFCSAAASAFLPAETFGSPSWRAGLPEAVKILLGDTVSPQPWISVFWWALLAGTTAFGLSLLTVTIEGRRLAFFLHAVALIVAIYAGLCVADFQTGWRYPFAGNAPFGFLPNKNHTATLLFVGAIISFGLMQWEIARGHKGSAVLAALCGAPPLAALLFFSNSRAGVVFLAVGLMIWAAGAGRSGSRKVIFAAVGILVVFLCVLFLAGGSEVRNRLSSLLNEAVSVRGEEMDAPKDLDFRQPIFRDTFDMISAQPWAGVGLGQFKYVFPQYRDESARAAVILHPESDWLMVAAESGLPAMALLLGLTLWYAVQSWRGRSGGDGLLRWTAASAVLAAVLHGTMDVPWHRVSLGWFLLVIAVVCVPRTTGRLKYPVMARLACVLVGLALLAGAAFMTRGLSAGQPPLPYRWKVYNKELTPLGSAMAWEKGEAKADEAVAFYPLEKDAHYWVLAFTEATGEKLEGIIQSARGVEPVLPQTAEGQAALWRGVDGSREAEAWAEAVRRSLRIDGIERMANGSRVRGLVDRALQSLRDNTSAQIEFVGLLEPSPVLQAQWFRSASAEAAAGWLGGQPEAASWLDGLPPELQQEVLNRWITLPSAAGAVGYMEARNVGTPRPYWRQLAKYYAKTGDKARAVGIVAEAEGVTLDGTVPEGDFGRQLSALRDRGNEVAVRRLLKEAAEAEKADPDQLRVAVASYAASGDWEMAWKAASRLASARKNGQ
jgi:O-antigen ligase